MKKVKSKVGRRTVIRRLAERGYTAQKKFNKESYSEAQVTAHARPDDDGLELMIRRGNL